jgi:hypothetical protein
MFHHPYVRLVVRYSHQCTRNSTRRPRLTSRVVVVHRIVVPPVEWYGRLCTPDHHTSIAVQSSWRYTRGI